MADDIVVKLTAELFKTLGHPVRIKILHMLSQGELCVCNMIEEIDIEQSNFSQHLGILKRQGLIDSRKDGQRVIYWIAYPSIIKLLGVAEQILSEQIGHSQSLLKFLK
ncbi:ArsR/SmtB family transcription factor [Sporomusa acidovorans]|uniref:HTH-type transcriptional regulator n=1 Tax=Sporomusa acidovorans (strain ATCC 49682 / DSM 3132 / Mol) TaxID=1123286 RepID=A0ABZ3IYZ3_SPOA4|nr:metalloregulator ArsR/SmtB family transcription factor [Sporomusa acidovorans]OZC14124.1 putative HTH-type transcriptional regulator [Sporomusa acidovorans DSM 3132]SDE69003.1 transcriptional regulator, ArsR family [Sporomusa acidovorans]